MAILKGDNLFLKGVSGRIGDLVIRQRNGKTILSKVPRRSSRPATAQQKAQRQKFAAMVHAKKAAKFKN